MKFKKASLTIWSILISFTSFCQFEPLIENILSTDTFNRDHSREKIFIHYDRPYYNIHDTLWLKGYIVTARDFAAADSSKIAYIEIINSSGELIKRVSTYCSFGIFYSNIELNETDFKQGTYLLRAYTNYMRNYGDSLFFESRFKVIDPRDHEWNLTVHTISLAKNRFVVSAAFQPLLKQPLQPQKVSVILRLKNKIIFKQNTSTDRNGNISIDTLLDKEGLGTMLQLEISNDDHFKTLLHVPVNEELQTDLQFLPEGGTFLANKLQQVGFKAVNIFGKGIDVKGKIENGKKQLVTTFSSVHDGMGTVWLQPEINERYTAVLDNGATFQLPLPQQSGTQLQITNQPGSDSIRIMIDASPDLYNKKYFFRASARGITCAMGVVHIKDKAYRLSISKDAFPSGICRFTLFDGNYLPVNERIILVWHHDTLTLTLAAQKTYYGNKDSVHLLLTAKNINNAPTVGSFSVAVIDTGQVHYPKYGENIISCLLLSSDLKGTIEGPFYYFDNPLPEAIEALMLTQGWVQYKHFYNNPAFEYEKAFTVSGRVSNLFNKPVEKANMTLFGKDGKSNAFFFFTETDKKGHFTFTNFPLFTTDSANMLIRALNKRGKSFGVGVDVNLPVFPGYHAPVKPALYENILYDTSETHYIQQRVEQYNQWRKEKGYLQEVVVSSKIKIPGSKNLNADGGADQVITAKTLETMPKKSLLDVLYSKLPGFNKGPLGRSRLQVYKVNGDMIIFIIDGYNIVQQYQPVSESSTAFTEYEETYLNYINAEDVAGVEVMKTSKNKNAYENYYDIRSTALLSYVFIEITTYSGHGAFDRKVPGMYLYKPLAPVIAKTFYSPRYNTSGDDINTPDYRSTLYWKPGVITNEKGEAEFSFYTSDSGSGYLVIVQGTDLIGGLGVVYFPIQIRKEDKPPGK